MNAWGSRDPHAALHRFSKGTAIRGVSMNSLLLKLAITATVCTLLSSNPTAAQILPPAKRAERVEITKAPALESARDDFAIIRWTTNNPGGTDVHFAVVQYGTDPEDLSQTAKSQIRINRGHPETIFRVRMPGLKPQTTYYYKVTSTESTGKSDGVESRVNQFTTPGPGERIVAYPPQPAAQPK
jgi:phosphodiesterase/alkaline phosphatase D-like protein